MTKGARPWEVRQHRMDADFPGHGQSTHVWWMRFQQVYAGEGESGGMARDSRLPLRLHSSLIADMMMRADVLTDDQDFAPDGNCSCLRGNRSSAWLSWSCSDVMYASAVMVPLYQIQFFLNSIETACTCRTWQRRERTNQWSNRSRFGTSLDPHIGWTRT